MGKRMKTSREGVIGCWRSKCSYVSFKFAYAILEVLQQLIIHASYL
jgi:hypothetical protein